MKLLDILEPFANIYQAYLDNNLDDEARRYWGVNNEHENGRELDEIVIYEGRGGKTLLTLQDCYDVYCYLKEY